MQLTLYTDYSLRVLLYLAAREEPATIAEIAESYSISRNHLVKVVHELGRKGYVKTERGRGGGISLAHAPGKIGVGEVVRAMEPNFHIVECFDPGKNACVITPQCALRHALIAANAAFMKVLDGYTLADVTRNRAALVRVLGGAA